MPGGGEGSPRAALDGGSALFIPAHSQQQEAAWGFMASTVLDDDVMTAFRTDPTRGGILPAITTPFERPEMNRPLDFFGGQNTTALYLDVYRDVPAVGLWGPHYTRANEAVRRAVQQVATGAATPADALAAAQAELEPLLR